MSFSSIKIGSFLTRSKIPIDIVDNKEYKRVTIRIKHNGVSLRDVQLGKRIGTKKQFVLKTGQFILSKIDARYGAFGVAGNDVNDAIITGNFWAYDVDKKMVNIDWFNQYTSSPQFYELCERASSGITHRKYLDEVFFLNHQINLPSVDEQLVLIDKIKSQKDRFNSLIKEQDCQTETLKKFRRQILQDAVQGKLVPQDPKDEPATVLLEKIKAEKEKLIKKGKLKKQKPLPPIKEEEIPFKIPKSWVWSRLSDLGQIHGGGTPSMSNPEYWNGKILWVSPKDMKGKIISDSELKITQKGVDNSSTKIIPTNSIIIVGRSGILKRKIPVAINMIPITVNQDMKVLIPYINDIYAFIYFLFLGMESYILKNYVKFGMTVHSLKYKEFESLLVPCPPKEEQDRIIKKIEQLLILCYELEENIKQNQKLSQQLLQSALKEALEPK